MTKYEKLSTLDGLAGYIYDADKETEACINSPLRDKDGWCPIDEYEIIRRDCINCIKMWLLGEAEEDLIQDK